jgi:hypothetical protein
VALSLYEPEKELPKWRDLFLWRVAMDQSDSTGNRGVHA